MIFQVSSNQDTDEPSDLVFSLSRTFAKLFRGVTIDGNSSERVYIHYRPVSRNKANSIEEKTFEIYVRCRLLKDYQRVRFFFFFFFLNL